MARESLETSPFATVPSVLGLGFVGVLWVPEKVIIAEAAPLDGTTLKNFLPKVPSVNKGRALTDGYGDFVLTLAGEQVDGWQAFYFAKQRTPEEIAVPYKTERADRPGVPWAGVMLAPVVADLVKYDGDGGTYVDKTVWDFQWGDRYYDGPCKIVEEYFASHASHNIPDPIKMQPQGGSFDYGVGGMTVPECLHGELPLEYDIGEGPVYPAQTFNKTFPATTPTTRPDEMILEDGEKLTGGLWIRKRVRAFKP